MFGFPAALLSLVTGIPGTVMVLGNISHTSSFPAGLYPVNVLLALYVILFLIHYSHLKVDEPETADESPDTGPKVEAAVIGDPEDTPGEQPAGVPKQESCLEFLEKAYNSKEQFFEGVKSPFMRG